MQAAGAGFPCSLQYYVQKKSVIVAALHPKEETNRASTPLSKGVEDMNYRQL